MASSIEIFYSYSHHDEKLREELEKQLSLLKWQGLITGWHDRRILPGQEWADEIDTHLNTAHIVLLLVSPDFMASNCCYGIEVKRAMERHEREEAIVVPVILRPVMWQGAPFGKLQALPTDGKPVTGSSWHSMDEAFFNVADGIRTIVQQARKAEEVESRRANTELVIQALKKSRYDRRTIKGVVIDTKLPYEEVHVIITELVIQALENSNYKVRTIEGVSAETGLTDEEVQNIIKELGDQVVKSSNNKYTTRTHSKRLKVD